MIEIYSPSNTGYDYNGDATLMATLCDISYSLDAVWPIELEHPIDSEGRWKNIVENAVIKVPTPYGKQLFRLKKVQKVDRGITANGAPIFMDCQNEVFLLDVRPTGMNGAEALERILSGNSKYTSESDITKIGTAYYVLKNAAEAIRTADNAFLKTWGGEIIYDNYKIIINEKIGSDNGFEILYGKNILPEGLTETVDMSNVVTRIVPKAYNGRMLSGNSPWVDSPLINDYPIVRTKVVEYSNIRLAEDIDTYDSEVTADIIVVDTLAQLEQELIKAAKTDFEDGADKPEVSIKCKFAMLKNTTEYRDYIKLEDVKLGDTIHCRHNLLGITSDARIIEMTWDCIKEEPKSVQVGSPTRSFTERVSTALNKTDKAITQDGTVIAENIGGIVDKDKVYINADSIVAGIITDKLEKNVWNLDTGEMTTSGAIVSGGTITGASINNGNGTFRVTESGHLIANSAEISGRIVGSTIQGSSIYSYSGDTSRLTTIHSGYIEVDSKFIEQDGSIYKYTQTLIGDTGLAVKSTYPDSPQSNLQVQLANGVFIRGADSEGTIIPNNNCTYIFNRLIFLYKDSNNFTRISPDNIEIYKNGEVVWQAIPNTP